MVVIRANTMPPDMALATGTSCRAPSSGVDDDVPIDLRPSSSDCGRMATCGAATSLQKPSVIGQPIAALVERMLAKDCCDGAAADDSSSASAVATTETTAARASLEIAWPPTFPVGGPAEVVELRATLSYSACDALSYSACDALSYSACCDTTAGLIDSSSSSCCSAATASASDAPAVTAADGDVAARRLLAARRCDAALAAAASEVCGRVLAVREDLVVGEEGVALDAGAVRASARLRLQTDQPGVTSCILASHEGLPTLESFHDAAPLIGLPQAARDEAHRLLWRMMHEALPPNHSLLPFDPDAFRSPLDRMAPKMQAALSWAWCHHFRAFAHDFSFLLDCLPASAASTSPRTWAMYDTPGPSSPSASSPSSSHDADVSHYQSVLAQMVGFLRDNDMFACLATLLQTAVSRGLTLVTDGNCLSAVPASAASYLQQLQDVQQRQQEQELLQLPPTPSVASAPPSPSMGWEGFASPALPAAAPPLSFASPAPATAPPLSFASPAPAAAPSLSFAPVVPLAGTTGDVSSAAAAVITAAVSAEDISFPPVAQPVCSDTSSAAAAAATACGAVPPGSCSSYCRTTDPNLPAAIILLLVMLYWPTAPGGNGRDGGGSSVCPYWVTSYMPYIIAVLLTASRVVLAFRQRNQLRYAASLALHLPEAAAAAAPEVAQAQVIEVYRGGGGGGGVAAHGGGGGRDRLSGGLSAAVHVGAAVWYAAVAVAAVAAAAPTQAVASAVASAALFLPVELVCSAAAPVVPVPVLRSLTRGMRWLGSGLATDTPEVGFCSKAAPRLPLNLRRAVWNASKC